METQNLFFFFNSAWAQKLNRSVVPQHFDDVRNKKFSCLSLFARPIHIHTHQIQFFITAIIFIFYFLKNFVLIDINDVKYKQNKIKTLQCLHLFKYFNHDFKLKSCNTYNSLGDHLRTYVDRNFSSF